MASKRLRIILWLVAAANFVAAVGLKAIHESQPSKEFWASLPGWLPWVCFLVTILVPTTQPLLVEVGERRMRTRLQRADDVRQFLAAGFLKIVEDTGLDWKRIGVHVFLVKGFYKWKSQQRIAKIKLANSVPSGVTWTRGKGVIGLCWETHRPVTHDLRSLEQHEGISESDWDALPAGVEKFGMSHADFLRTRGSYGIVSAVPILLDGENKYIGCVSFDTPSDCPEKVSEKMIEEDLRGVAKLLEVFLAKSA